MLALQVLAHHNQRHEQDLDHVGHKKPEDEGRRWIDAQALRPHRIPGQPENGPTEDDEEETKAADAPDTSAWIKFTSFAYEGKTAIVPENDEYLNPIIAGFYPDPSICRVGDDYYLVNSAFNYFPSIPVWHSKDLVNWTQIGNVIDRPSQFAMRGGQVSAGTYAPTIRYHNGTFYVVCTLVGGIGNLCVTAQDPKGPWAEPIKLQGVGGIDPSLFNLM